MLFRRALLQASFGLSVASGTLGLGEGVVDLRGSLRHSGQYPMRDFDAVHSIVVHHTATKGQGWGTIADYHVLVHKWAGIGYHCGVSWDGTVFLLNDFDRHTNHCGGCNSRTLSLALLGNFEERPLPPQMEDRAEDLVRLLIEIHPQLAHLRYHAEFKPTLCPGRYGRAWVQSLRSRINTPIPEAELPHLLERMEREMLGAILH